MSFALEGLTIMTFGTSKYAVNKVKFCCMYLEVYFNILCFSICSVWLSVGALALIEPNWKLQQIQTHIIGWENNERGKIWQTGTQIYRRFWVGSKRALKSKAGSKTCPAAWGRAGCYFWARVLPLSLGWRCVLRPPISGRSSVVLCSEPQQGRQQSCSGFMSIAVWFADDQFSWNISRSIRALKVKSPTNMSISTPE